jgi:hypothetical protein
MSVAIALRGMAGAYGRMAVSSSSASTRRYRQLPFRHNLSLRLSSSSIQPRFSNNNQTRKRIKYWILAGTVALTVGISYEIRRWRSQQLDEWLSDYPLNIKERFPPNGERSINDLILLLKRTGLMGKTESVKDELPRIRQWHRDHGFPGILTVREYGPPNHDNQEEEREMTFSNYWTMFEDFVNDPLEFARRECYYLYTETKPGLFGQTKTRHELFCRGTTLVLDLLACLQFWNVYDEELGCHLHVGFLNHANRVVDDVIPLLGPPSLLSAGRKKESVTVEVSGHSLGGAVSFIVAAKLKKRGYNVIRVTSIATPRICKTRGDGAKLAAWLPHDTLRVEQDVDFAPFFMPNAHHPCSNKLWLLTKREQTAYIPAPVDENTKQSESDAVPKKCPPAWIDNVWIHFLVPELVIARGIPHRYVSYCLYQYFDL